jgi:16S rRNA (adenine1518-N6/adenine1519-N6)-dimethyltransferase
MNTREKLQELGVKPVGGQHFIDRELAVEKFLDQAETSGKTVLEIGAGTGNITQKIEAENIYLVEKDTSLANELEKQGFDTFNEDFLEMKIPEDVEYLVGNLPFEISSEVLEKAGKLQLPSTFIVQDELADKVVAGPSDSKFNFFSFLMSYYFLPVKAATISSRNYYPEPEVDTAVLKLFPEKERHGVLDEEEQDFLDFAKALFTHRRKKLRNSVVDARNMLDVEKDEVKEFRDDLPYSEKRVNELEVVEVKEVFDRFEEEIKLKEE